MHHSPSSDYAHTSSVHSCVADDRHDDVIDDDADIEIIAIMPNLIMN